MIKKIKLVIKKFIPEVVIDYAVYLSMLFVRFKIFKILKVNRLLKDKYFGDKVYIVGNGPSLNNFDLTKIYDSYSITMNHFEYHPEKDKLKIVAHCVGEPFKASTWEDPMPMITGVMADSYWFNADSIGFFEKLEKKYFINFYLPGVRSNSIGIRGDDLTSVSLQYQSTAQMAINVALFLGFKDIYLLGFDHDWLATRGFSEHFYQENNDAIKVDFSRRSYTEMIQISLNLFKIYEHLKRLAEKNNARIWNLSNPSYLDVFPYGKDI